MSTQAWLLVLPAFIIAIGVLVTVHEFGHYWVAKRCGIKVLTFSIGFGRPLAQWQRGETTWQVGAIPLGGYVRMLGEHDDEIDPSELTRSFNRRPVWQRMAVLLAGPVANFLFAIVIYWLMYMVGVTVLRPVMGDVFPGSVAARAGLEQGDQVIAISGEAVSSWDDIYSGLIRAAVSGQDASLLVRRTYGMDMLIKLPTRSMMSDAFVERPDAQLGISPLVSTRKIGYVEKGSPAEKAGLKVGDEPVEINGQRVKTWFDFVETVRSQPGVLLHLSVRRGGELIPLQIIPVIASKHGAASGRIGAAPELDHAAWASLRFEQQLNPREALGQALSATYNSAAFLLKMVGKMLTGDVSTRQLSGPVSMAKSAGETAALGIQTYLRYLCMISISLGVMNLLPIPVLDGGHLMYHLAELLRGKPVSDRVAEFGLRIGIGLLVSLMMFALWNDLTRVSGG
ncbi:RIP metalloprotease RseP [Burkholderiaceae bacterium DAT-1]|nr:RIP metalloprotease RseP [Burkholderiaceae bacterium DAT-1]